MWLILRNMASYFVLWNNIASYDFLLHKIIRRNIFLHDTISFHKTQFKIMWRNLKLCDPILFHVARYTLSVKKRLKVTKFWAWWPSFNQFRFLTSFYFQSTNIFTPFLLNSIKYVEIPKFSRFSNGCA